MCVCICRSIFVQIISSIKYVTQLCDAQALNGLLTQLNPLLPSVLNIGRLTKILISI